MTPSPICPDCKTALVPATLEGPCCGGEYDCVDYYPGYVCPKCGYEIEEYALHQIMEIGFT